MAKIVVFDSGLGSLSIIRAIQSVMNAEIVYFADQLNFPYGNKSYTHLDAIISKTIDMLEARFSPDCIVMASNTPSLMLNVSNSKVIGVRPPLAEACKISKSGRIGILATDSAIKSNGLLRYIDEQKNLSERCVIHKISGSVLVALVESGQFLTDVKMCMTDIKMVLEDVIYENSIDVITLSSTHLSFLQTMLCRVFPNVRFVDPSMTVAKNISRLYDDGSTKDSLSVFTSADPNALQETLTKLGIRNDDEVLSMSI